VIFEGYFAKIMTAGRTAIAHKKSPEPGEPIQGLSLL